jgi:Putative prokaryotic signal transducing protein
VAQGSGLRKSQNRLDGSEGEGEGEGEGEAEAELEVFPLMSNSLTTLQSYGNLYEAELVRGLLESHGIPVFLADENMARVAADARVGWVRLQVREADMPDARQILDTTLAEAVAEAGETPAEHACPICGGTRSEPYSDAVRWLTGLFLLGIPNLIRGRSRKCQICGNIWRG